MSEEIELAAKTTGEVVAALTEQSGALAVPKEYANYVAARIHLRHYPRLVESAMKAAKKIEEAGLPCRAFSALDEPLLTKILEGMAEEADPSLQEAWENLLANALTDESSLVRRAFPGILSELEPIDALLLDELAKKVDIVDVSALSLEPMPSWVPAGSLDNLVRSRLLRQLDEQVDTKFQVLHGPPRIGGYTLTTFGTEFIQACRSPSSRSGTPTDE
jgi:hypothetical protein